MIKINEEFIEREDFERIRDTLNCAFNHIHENSYDIKTDFKTINLINTMLNEIKVCHDLVQKMLDEMEEE